jgi:hypothetical protein
MQREHGRVPSNGDSAASPGTKELPVPCRIQTAQDVIALLQEQIQAVRADREASTLEKARMIGHLARLALKAIEAGNVVARLEALEAVLKQRKETGKP